MSANGVLGEYEHEIEFHNDGDFAIIFGPNGVGKTRFLEVIDAMANRKFDRLEVLPFRSATIEFTDGWSLQVAHEAVLARHLQDRSASEVFLNEMWQDLTKRFGDEVDNDPIRVLQFRLTGPHGDTYEAPPIILERQDSDFLTSLSAIWARRDWSSGDPDLHVSFSADGTRRYVRNRDGHRHRPRRLPDVIEKFTDDLDVRLIETQRLLTLEVEEKAGGRKETTSRPTIEAYSKVVRQHLAQDLSENSRLGQRLDSTFPRRMLQAGESSRVTEQEIRSRLKDQSSRRARIEQITPLGLGPALPLPAGPLSAGQRSVLELYLEDADAKLSTFASTVEKIDLLEQIINARLLGKRLEISAEEGILITRNRDQERIPLAALSSGEQHEIIMFFDLLFNVKRGGLVLIDEPEISLHIAWQQKFIEDVLTIAQLVGFQFVIATHSPQIIEGFWGQAQRLGPPTAPFSDADRTR